MKKLDFTSRIQYNIVNLTGVPIFNRTMLDLYNQTFGTSTVTQICHITKRFIGKQYKKLGFEIDTGGF